MFKIAILDDDRTALMISSSAVEAFWKEKSVEFQLFTFTNPEYFLASAKEEKFDLSFLDIDLGSFSGLNVAELLLSIKKDAQIIFLSQREDLVFECLTYHPFGFIRKSKLIEDFALMMEQFYNSYLNTGHDDKRIEIVDKTKMVSFNIGEIVYIEGDRNYQRVVLRNGTEQNIRVSMGSLEERLNPYGFIRIHKGYLLNYLYIRSITSDEVVLTSGKILPMSKKRRDDIMKQYLAISRKKESVII